MYLKKKLILLLLSGVILYMVISFLTYTPQQSKQSERTFATNRTNTTDASNLTEPFTSNLPIVIIDTSGKWIRDEPKIPARMKIIYDESGGRNTLKSQHIDFDGKIGIELRGKTSLGFPKNQYGVEVQDDSKATTKMHRYCNCQQNRTGF